MDITKYKHVFFRLNQKCYIWGKGWVLSSAARDEWEKQIVQLLIDLGLTIKPIDRIFTCYEGFNDLGEGIYMHPMDFSGIVHEDNIAKWEAIFRKAESKYWTIRIVDAYPLRKDSCIAYPKRVEENRLKYLELSK